MSDHDGITDLSNHIALQYERLPVHVIVLGLNGFPRCYFMKCKLAPESESRLEMRSYTGPRPDVMKLLANFACNCYPPSSRDEVKPKQLQLLRPPVNFCQRIVGEEQRLNLFNPPSGAIA